MLWSSVLRVVLLCKFLVLAGNRFWLYILLCTWSTIQLWCCVRFFWFWREIVFGVTYVLSVQYSCAVVSVFLLWREKFITTGKKSSSHLSGGLCCCVQIVFGVTYLLSVQYSCVVVSVFLLWQKSLLRPEKKVLVICLAGCAVVSK